MKWEPRQDKTGDTIHIHTYIFHETCETEPTAPTLLLDSLLDAGPILKSVTDGLVNVACVACVRTLPQILPGRRRRGMSRARTVGSVVVFVCMSVLTLIETHALASHTYNAYKRNS